MMGLKHKICIPSSRGSRRFFSIVLLVVLLVILSAQVIHAQDAATLTVWLPPGVFDDDHQRIANDQISTFEQANPGIVVNVQFKDYSSSDFSVAAAAGEAPDVILLSDLDSAQAEQAGLLLPLDPYFQADEDFLPDAVNANTYDKVLYGLPFVRFGCVPRYDNLVASSETKSPDIAAKLINYLTQAEQQSPYVSDLNQYYPTRLSLDQKFGVTCPQFDVLRPAPQLIPVARQVGSELDNTLRNVLGDVHLKPALATIYDPDANLATPSPDQSPQQNETDTMIVLAPVQDYSEDQVKSLLPDGIFVGAVRIGEKSVAAEYLKISGDFAIRCSENGDNTACQFVGADGKTVYNIASGDLTVYDGHYLYSDAFFTDLSITVCIFGHTYVIRIG